MAPNDEITELSTPSVPTTVFVMLRTRAAPIWTENETVTHLTSSCLKGSGIGAVKAGLYLFTLQEQDSAVPFAAIVTPAISYCISRRLC